MEYLSYPFPFPTYSQSFLGFGTGVAPTRVLRNSALRYRVHMERSLGEGADEPRAKRLQNAATMKAKRRKRGRRETEDGKSGWRE